MRGDAPPEVRRSITAIKAPKAPKAADIAPAMKALSRQERSFYAAQTRGLRQDIQERKKYASRIFVLCCTWIFAVFALLAAQGLAFWTHFSLPQPVLLAAIGSTTANILGVFLIVARYLFPSSGKGD